MLTFHQQLQRRNTWTHKHELNCCTFILYASCAVHINVREISQSTFCRHFCNAVVSYIKGTLRELGISHCVVGWWVFVFDRQASKHRLLSLSTVFLVSWDSSVILVTGYLLDHRGRVVQFPTKSREFFIPHKNRLVGRDNSVGIATPGIESRWGRDFPHRSRPALGLTQPPIY